MNVGELYVELGLNTGPLYQKLKAVKSAMLGTEKVLDNMNVRLKQSTQHFKAFSEATNNIQATRAFSQVEGAVRSTRNELAMLGFGRTKAEIQAAEGQLYNFANVKMTRLKDEIALTEKAIKQMKESADASKYTEQIKAAEEALKQYKAELADSSAIQKMAEVNGYAVQKIFGKDTFVKPIDEGLKQVKAKLTGFFNSDLAAMANTAYNQIDAAAKKIVGTQETAALQKQKITALAGAYDQIGLSTRMAAIGVGALGYAIFKDMPSFQEATKAMKGAFMEIFKAIKPTLDAVFQATTAAANMTKEFLKANPAIASFSGHMALLGGSALIFVAAFAPIAGLLIRHRALFQGLATSMIALRTGGIAVLAPQVVALQKTFQLFQNAIFGLPKILMGLPAALLTFVRMLPGLIINFVKLNPVLTAFAAIAYVIKANWETIGPVLAKIWDDLKLAFRPIMELFKEASGSIVPPLISIFQALVKVIGTVLLVALKAIEPVIRAIALLLNGQFAGAWYTIKGAIIKAVTDIKSFMSPTWKEIGDIISKAIDNAKNTISKGFDNIKSTTSNVWNGIKSFFVSFWQAYVQNVTSNLNTAKNTLTNSWNAMKTSTMTVWNGIKTGIMGVWSGIKSGVSSAASGVVSTLKTTLNGAWSYIKSIPSQAVGWGKSIIQGLANGIRSIHIPMPHISMSLSSKSIGGVSIPMPNFSVNWYDKGGIFNNPAIIGVGEKRPEFVGALDDLRKIVREESCNGGPIQLIVNLDGRVISNQLYNLERSQFRGGGKRG